MHSYIISLFIISSASFNAQSHHFIVLHHVRPSIHQYQYIQSTCKPVISHWHCTL